MAAQALAVMAIVAMISHGQAQEQPAGGVPASEWQIRRDCTPDALRYCKATYAYGRNAIIACMIQNKAKLQPRCRAHFYD